MNIVTIAGTFWFSRARLNPCAKLKWFGLLYAHYSLILVKPIKLVQEVKISQICASCIKLWRNQIRKEAKSYENTNTISSAEEKPGGIPSKIRVVLENVCKTRGFVVYFPWFLSWFISVDFLVGCLEFFLGFSLRTRKFHRKIDGKIQGKFHAMVPDIFHVDASTRKITLTFFVVFRRFCFELEFLEFFNRQS